MMRFKAVQAIILIGALLSWSLATLGQRADSNGERIQVLREEIKKREAADVPLDLKILNRSKLIERRAELLTLLNVEIDNLKKFSRDLGSSITPEERSKVDDAIRTYQVEIRNVATAMQSDLALQIGNDGATRTEVAALRPADSTANNSRSVSDSNPNNRRAPPSSVTNPPVTTSASVPSSNSVSSPAQTPSPTPSQTSLSSEENKKTTAPLDCNEARKALNAKQYSELDQMICKLPSSIVRERGTNPTNRLFLTGTTDYFQLIKIMIAKKDTPGFLVDAEETRLDKQVGASALTPGSGALTIRGGAPAILGFAVENGGLERSVNGSQITFRGNPVGLINALSNKGFITTTKEDQQDSILRFLKKTSFALTFNTDRGPQPGTLTATREQLSSVSARIELINKRKPELYIKDWENFLDKQAQPLTNLISKTQPELVDAGWDPRVFPYFKWKDAALEAWWEGTQQAIANATEADLDKIIQNRIDKLPLKELAPETIAILDRLSKQLGAYSSGRDDLLKTINKGTVVTLEYLNKREINAPNTSNFTFIAEKGTSGGGIDFTFNASLTMFDNLGALRNFVRLNPILPQPRRIRDFQFAGQFDIPLGDVRDFGHFVLFGAGRYERLLENASTDVGIVLPNTKGDIGYFQLGVKVPIKGTGFKIPFSVTFANRTELVKEKTIRGNIGFTLDLDTFFGKFKPF